MSVSFNSSLTILGCGTQYSLWGGIDLKSFFYTCAFSCALLLSLPTEALAEKPQPVQQSNSNAVWFENWLGLRNATMTISQPDGEIVAIFAEKGTPVFELSGSRPIDGIYRYTISAATEEEVEIKNKQNNGRGTAAKSTIAVPFDMSGQFHVHRGVIVEPEKVEEKE
ncbi:MAG: hypothetical protein AAF231_13400 [Pseudomonadota bacterium]